MSALLTPDRDVLLHRVLLLYFKAVGCPESQM